MSIALLIEAEKSMKRSLVRTVGSVSSSAVHAFSAGGRDFSFHISCRTCCNPSKSHIILSCTPINMKTFTSWRNQLLWKTGIGSRPYRWPFHIETLHWHVQSGKRCLYWRWLASPQLSAPVSCTGLCTWLFCIFLTCFSTTSRSHAISTTYISSRIKHRSCCQQITKFLKPKKSSATYLILLATALFPKERKARPYHISFTVRSLLPSAETVKSKPHLK